MPSGADLNRNGLSVIDRDEQVPVALNTDFNLSNTARHRLNSLGFSDTGNLRDIGPGDTLNPNILSRNTLRDLEFQSDFTRPLSSGLTNILDRQTQTGIGTAGARAREDSGLFTSPSGNQPINNVAERKARGISSREQDRFGIGFDAAQKQAENRATNLGVREVATQSIADTDLQERQTLESLEAERLNVARGLQRSSNETAAASFARGQQAQSAAEQRAAQEDAAEAAERSQILGLAGGALGYAQLGATFGGPVGFAIGFIGGTLISGLFD